MGTLIPWTPSSTITTSRNMLGDVAILQCMHVSLKNDVGPSLQSRDSIEHRDPYAMQDCCPCSLLVRLKLNMEVSGDQCLFQMQYAERDLFFFLEQPSDLMELLVLEFFSSVV